MCRSEPAKQEEVASAKFTAEGDRQPEEGALDKVSQANTSKIDRSAVRAMGIVEHSLQ